MRGEARLGMAGQVAARRCRERHGVARPGWARLGMAGQGKARAISTGRIN